MVLQATTVDGEIVKLIATNDGDLITQSFLEQPTTGQVKLGTAEATAVQGGESIPIADPNERPGWLFTKPVANADKFNYFYYDEGTKAITLDDLTNLNAILSVDTYTNSQSLPFFNVYTKPQGVGDAGPPAFPYHSKITYSITAEEHIVLGESVQVWGGITKPTNHPGKRFVEWNTKAVQGTGLGTEEIWYITLHTDSTSPINTQILVEELGYTARASIIITVEPIKLRLGLVA